MSTSQRIVLVTRKTDFEALLERHATLGQARFFLERRGQSMAPVRAQHDRFQEALSFVSKAVPRSFRQARVERDSLDRFLFEPEDIVVAVGQDGLIANLSKYLQGQQVIGINPDQARFDGVLVKNPPQAAADLLQDAATGRLSVERRTMAEASLDDGQRLLALNEIFIGHQSHQSARYHIAFNAQTERHSSSGVVVATGTGSTGWVRSIARQREAGFALPLPGERCLSFFVREAFPSLHTKTELTEARLELGCALKITSRMNEGGVIFGDGIEEDRIRFPYGVGVSVAISERTLNLA